MSPSRRRVPRPASVALSAAALLAMLSASIAPLVPERGCARSEPRPVGAGDDRTCADAGPDAAPDAGPDGRAVPDVRADPATGSHAATSA